MDIVEAEGVLAEIDELEKEEETEGSGTVCLSVCLSVFVIFLSNELSKLPQWDISTNVVTANLSNTNFGLTSMIMNCTNQEIVIQ